MVRWCLPVWILVLIGFIDFGAAGAADAKPAANKAAKKKAVHDRTVEASFKLADKDGDGKLSLAEYKAGQWNLANPAAEFKKLDTDNDGALSLAEYEAGWPKKEAAGGNKGGKKGVKKNR
jgi:hypothetical protein